MFVFAQFATAVPVEKVLGWCASVRAAVPVGKVLGGRASVRAVVHV